jgi:NAD(P)H dehydrogenase (quinone)
MAADHLGTEKALADSALPGWTVLRNNWYFETLLVTLAQPLASGRWYSAARDGRIAYVARDDLARAAAFALASSFTGKRTLTLSGARGYSADEVAVAVGETVGRSLSVIHIPLDEFAKVMTASGSPGPVATLLASVESAVAAGDLADVTEDYQALTGLDPTPLRDWLSGNHAAFRQPLETESGAQPNPVPAAMHEGR